MFRGHFVIHVASLGAAVLLGTAVLGCDRVVLDFSSDPSVMLGSGGGTVTDPPPPPPANSLEVEGIIDLAAHNSGSRVCSDGGDAVSYPLLEADGRFLTLETEPNTGCLVPGDELMLIHLQGEGGNVEHVGKYELLRVLNVEGGRIEVVAAPLQDYGAATSTGFLVDSGRVVLQRIPSYTRLTIPQGSTLTSRAFHEGGTGVLALRVVGDALVDGLVTMGARGYRGGVERPEPNDHGQQGESIGGPGSLSTEPNHGGGGGGLGDQERAACVQDGNAGGGGAHLQPGADAIVEDQCSGEGRGLGGSPYAASGRLFLGSGGGSGGVDNVRVDNPPGAPGGAGGGIIWIAAQSITGSGAIESRGENGVGDEPGLECELGFSTSECFDHSGPGGGGAGGSILLITPQLLGLGTSVAGGNGGNGYDFAGGNGGNGSPGVLVTQ